MDTSNKKFLFTCPKCSQKSFIKAGITHRGLDSKDDKEYKPLSITQLFAQTVEYVMYFIAFSYLVCGISQEKCREAVTFIFYLVKQSRQLPPDAKIAFDFIQSLNLTSVAHNSTPCMTFNKFVSLDRIPCSQNDRFNKSKSNRKHNHPTNPSITFMNQGLEEWLKWLLSLLEVEKLIEDYAAHPNLNPNTISDYLQSPAFKKLAPTSQKSTDASLDLIANHLFPLGQPITARLGALIGDILETHEVAGFSLHLAKIFCSCCTVLNTKMSAMQIGKLWNCMATLSAARQWHDASKPKTKRLVKHSGVRLSELN
ncbi:hypothetical protein VP01_2872g1 [Puccinia sorghi]|uniref:Uncharacterized protein n=1 Tax=Puccinia sorghi TaxID=27349 RepID=A0A0L6V1U1_9BASI|nr:hypothetical protein VP01_2872g1 [Puccinia sorghi]